MYLTRDEFLILSAIKQGKGFRGIEETTGIKLYTNDPRIEALCQKYGIYGEDTMYFEKYLSEKADLNKVEIIDADKMPYYDYGKNWALVKKIPVCKKDILQLLKVFEKPEFNDTDDYYLQYSKDGLGDGLDLIDKENNEHHVRYCVDGEYCIGDDLVDE